MASYNNFIGIDIGKFSFVVAIYGIKNSREYDNDPSGITAFLRDFKKELAHSLCVLETTGGYEIELLLTLCDKNYAVHRANTRKVKNFIRSFGNDAKTDILDARALALYGYERADRLDKFVPPSKKALELYQLIQRRQDLKQMLVAEKNRLKSPRANEMLRNSCQLIIKTLSGEVEIITAAINELIEADPILSAKKQVLLTIAGIGDIVANELLILFPELGMMDRKQVASLAGLAPKANDSGRTRGYRRTSNGRNRIKPMLFLAAMAARNSKSELSKWYEKLVTNGKKKMVALVALMRKILVIANARIKDFLHERYLSEKHS